jgi:hypothetical protein
MPPHTTTGDKSPHSNPLLVLWLSAALMTTLLAGCGDDRGPERVVVSGTVTYNGKPIPDGSIRFVPTAASAAPISGAPIVAGRYKIESRGGVAMGTYRVQIEAYRQAANQNAPAAPLRHGLPTGEMREQYLPARHNTQTQLQTTIESGRREVTKDFELTD